MSNHHAAAYQETNNVNNEEKRPRSPQSGGSSAEAPPGVASMLSSAELKQKYRSLFETQHMSVGMWWRWRWRTTSDIGRVAAIGMIVAFAAAFFLSAAWISHHFIYSVREERALELQDVVQSLLQLFDAVRTEHSAAANLAAAVWQAATPEQIEALAPPSCTAVPGIGPLVDVFLNASAATSNQLDATIAVLMEHASVVSLMLAEDHYVAITASRNSDNDPVLGVGVRLEFLSRATRNPGLTQDRERQQLITEGALSYVALKRHLQGLRVWPGSTLAPPRVSLEQLHYFGLADYRANVYPTLALLPSELVSGYITIEQHIIRLALRAGFSSSLSLVAPVIMAPLAGALSGVLMQAYSAAADILNTTYQSSVSSSDYVSRCVNFVAAFDTVEYFNEILAPALMDDDLLWSYRRNFGPLDYPSELRRLRDSLLLDTLTGPSLLVGGASNSVAALASVSAGGALATQLMTTVRRSMLDPLMVSPQPPASRYMDVTIFAAVISFVFFVVLLFEQRHHAYLVIGLERDRVMEQTIKYIASVSDAVRTFDLEKARRITSGEARSATTTQGLSIVHNRLERCVASLTYLSLTLNPLLFTERAHSAARYYSIVRRSTPSGSGGGLMEEAAAIAAADAADLADRDAKPRLLTRTDVEEGVMDEAVANRLRSRLDRRDACFLYLDVAPLLEYSTSTEAFDVAHEYVPLVATVAEEAVVLHGGVFHSLTTNYFMGSWNVACDAPVTCDICEAAARAAFMLSARLNMMRRAHSAFRERFNASIAITAGDVTFAVYNMGPMSQSIVQIFGAPLLRAAAVMRANLHHQTSISIDDVAAERLAVCGLPSKPTELIRTAAVDVEKEETQATSNTRLRSQRRRVLEANTTDDISGCAHELISLARHRDPDLAARLAAYKSAFSLYQRGYHAEALKGFRKYTKQYGYDGSVERIQSLILS